VISLGITLSKPLNQDAPSFLFLLLGLLLVKRITAQSQVAHDLIVEVKQVEDCEGEHEYGEDYHDFWFDGDLSEEIEEGCVWKAGYLQVVVAEGVADSGDVDSRE
jgi:hypothetical protein